ncbi:hypothetical protein NM208_g5871 [Fusarium decemcellulare]|uniref:Uncharacterized protein n=1 Tax=Fusarium decemcellulare TaxID=57161 RepID=A0ACC1SF81_9HYPO|nr:hypothetical protein NM208_g5871 [Fusarium decemcellulare]
MRSNNRILKQFNKQLAAAFVVIAVSTFNYGFDNAGYATTQAMEPFQRQFGEYNESEGIYRLPSQWLALFNSLNYIGYGAGVILGSLVSARWGRRWCMFVMSAWAIVPAIMAVTAKSREQIMAARVLNYIYIGMELAVVPVYQSEIMPQEIRGFAVGSYQFSLMTGSLIVNAVCRGTSSLPGNEAWRIPFGLFFVIPVIVMGLIFFIPESPRWLLTKDRTEDARIALGRLRGGVLTDAEIYEQFASQCYALKREEEQGKYMELFQGKSLKRTAIVVAMNFFQQATGQSFASSYGAIFIRDIGAVNPFTMTLINSIVNLMASFVGLYLVDRFGRRLILFIGAGWMFSAIATMGGLGLATDPSHAVKTAIVAMLTVFAAGFVFSWAPLTYVVTTEVPALRLRDASQRTASIVLVVTSFVVNFSIPYLLYPEHAGLGSRVGFVFAGVIVLSVVFTYFCVPECKGKSLEEVDALFIQGVSLRQFGKHDARIEPRQMRMEEKDDHNIIIECNENSKV